MHITFIQAGGTIDKDHPRDELHNAYDFTEFIITRPAVVTILPSYHKSFTYDIIEAAKKNSTDLTDQDRQKILESVKKSTSDRVVITHGIHTILKTAEILNGKAKTKTIVLTGAMLPERFVNSDASFNVGMAVAGVQNLSPGVYIALHGRVVPWQEFPEHERKAKVMLGRDKKL